MHKRTNSTIQSTTNPNKAGGRAPGAVRLLLFWAVVTVLQTCPATACAQKWQMPWVSAPGTDGCRQMLVKKTFVLRQRPCNATLDIASTGRYIVYINGYNLTGNVLESSQREVRRYDAGRFLRADTNTVAVWCSPAGPSAAGGTRLALVLSARTAGGGSPFVLTTDTTWLCKDAGAATYPDGTELVDATRYQSDWNMNDGGVAEWFPVKRCTTGPATRPAGFWPAAYRIRHIQNYTYADDYGNTIVYRFARRFDGWVRLTLRGMAAGDTIRVNGLTYICTGTDDEQACRRFTMSASDIAVVSGPSGFNRENITGIEAVDICKFVNKSYLY